MNLEEFIIQRVEELCTIHNMSKYRLSQLTGISQAAFSYMSKKKTVLTIITISKICDAFGITIAQFFSGQGTYPDLNEDQKTLLEHWGKIDKKKQTIILNLIQALEEL